MRLTSLSVLALAAGLIAPAAFAATPAAGQAQSDPVVATVNGMQIHLSDIQQAAQNAPQQLQQMPPNQLFPLLVNQEIDRDALLVAARQENLEKQPAVAAAMAQAANVSLENAYVQQHVAQRRDRRRRAGRIRQGLCRQAGSRSRWMPATSW